jgi:hypothetical protein
MLKHIARFPEVPAVFASREVASDWLQAVITALQPFAAAPFEMQRLPKTG